MALNAKLMLSLPSDTRLVFLEGFDTAVVIMHILIQTSHLSYFV